MTTKSIEKISKSKHRPALKTVKTAKSAVLGRTALAMASQISKDPKKSKAFLQEAGIITKSGKLSARYG